MMVGSGENAVDGNGAVGKGITANKTAGVREDPDCSNARKNLAMPGRLPLTFALTIVRQSGRMIGPFREIHGPF